MSARKRRRLLLEMASDADLAQVIDLHLRSASYSRERPLRNYGSLDAIGRTLLLDFLLSEVRKQDPDFEQPLNGWHTLQLLAAYSPHHFSLERSWRMYLDLKQGQAELRRQNLRLQRQHLSLFDELFDLSAYALTVRRRKRTGVWLTVQVHVGDHNILEPYVNCVSQGASYRLKIDGPHTCYVDAKQKTTVYIGNQASQPQFRPKLRALLSDTGLGAFAETVLDYTGLCDHEPERLLFRAMAQASSVRLDDVAYLTKSLVDYDPFVLRDLLDRSDLSSAEQRRLLRAAHQLFPDHFLMPVLLDRVRQD